MKRRLQRRIRAYSDLVTAPRPAQFVSVGQLNSIRHYHLQGVIQLAGDLSADEKLALYKCLGHMADQAPSWAPCPLKALDAYRYAVDIGVAA
ncbi:MAG: hypothetical protein E7H60_23065 [Pseudomonas oryzihabitans]|uniref:hypothetical protein n=1 Tax=Pseudomonas oryzihabitans TaxID=47885 RepID=UPI0011A5C530|nr:hypothetical protein [Pseudomonas oryzihabitans]MDU4059430.1 hypothetical protein [Pseudomonas oryzihabitans]